MDAKALHTITVRIVVGWESSSLLHVSIVRERKEKSLYESLYVCRRVFERLFGKVMPGRTYKLTGKATLVRKPARRK